MEERIVTAAFLVVIIVIVLVGVVLLKGYVAGLSFL